jgi:hypothetical protein
MSGESTAQPTKESFETPEGKGQRRSKKNSYATNTGWCRHGLVNRKNQHAQVVARAGVERIQEVRFEKQSWAR